MHRIQRKYSNDTLTSIGMDSTLDSRMSSAEIPQMELLKVNYVHQCKEALMTKTGSVPSYNFMDYKNCPPHAMPLAKRPAGNRVTVKRFEAPNKPLPPPPPTIESWQLLQNATRTTNSQPKFIKPPLCISEKNLESSTVSKRSNASSYDTANEDSDATIQSGEAVKSNSWSYRNKMSTCDIRRDMLRAGIKSRADRIARIERTECEHSKIEPREPYKEAVRELEKIERTADSNVSPKEAVAKINQMFEAQKQIKNIPPQPTRPAPVPHKEPNRRLKPTPSLKETTQNKSLIQIPSNYSECSECTQESQRSSSNNSDNCSAKSQESVQYRRSDIKEGRLLSRIPKPIQDKSTLKQGDKQKTDLEWLKRNERIQKSKSIEQITSVLLEAKTKQERHSLDQQLMRNARFSGGNYHKAKNERVHIRKKTPATFNHQPIKCSSKWRSRTPLNLRL